MHNTLLLLNCRNIGTIKIKPDIPLNTKRLKSKKQPLFTYHVLTIKEENKQESVKSIGSGLHNRIHFCRGHFKQFTEEAPLFGKYTGLYWWQPHLRGQNVDGFVAKDYKVINE